MKTLTIVSFFVLNLFAQAGTIISTTGDVYIVREQHFPEVIKASPGKKIYLKDIIYSNKAARTLIRTTNNVPVFLTEKTSISILDVSKKQALYKAFIKLNYGSIKIYAKKNYITTPLALIQPKEGEVIISHSSTDNFTSVIPLNGSVKIIQTTHLSKKTFISRGKKALILEDKNMFKNHKSFIIYNLSNSVVEKINNKFKPELLLGTNYKPSFLDTIFRILLL